MLETIQNSPRVAAGYKSLEFGLIVVRNIGDTFAVLLANLMVRLTDPADIDTELEGCDCCKEVNAYWVSQGLFRRQSRRRCCEREGALITAQYAHSDMALGSGWSHLSSLGNLTCCNL